MDEQRQLTNAYHSNKLSHAYLFEGGDTQAMKQVAINFAELILCQTDSQCETKVSTYNHPDSIYTSTAGNTIRKEQVGQLVCHMNRLPIESTNRVYVTEDFEKLTAQGEDSILKFLEEPPDNTIAILLSTKPGRVLDTTRSRCQHVYFKPTGKEELISRLVEQGMFKPIAGMISTYITQIDNALALNEKFDLLALRKSVIHWRELLLTSKPMTLISITDLLKQTKNKKLQSLTIAAVNGFFEDIIRTKVNVEDKQIYSDLKNDIDQYAQELSFNQLILMFNQLTEAYKKLNQNVNPALVFEQIVIKGVS